MTFGLVKSSFLLKKHVEGAKYKYKYKYHKITLVLRMPNKHLAVQRIDIGFKQMWSRCLCRIQGVRMPMGRAPPGLNQ